MPQLTIKYGGEGLRLFVGCAVSNETERLLAPKSAVVTICTARFSTGHSTFRLHSASVLHASQEHIIIIIIIIRIWA